MAPSLEKSVFRSPIGAVTCRACNAIDEFVSNAGSESSTEAEKTVEDAEKQMESRGKRDC